MASIAEIQEAILSLPSEEYAQLRRWFTGLDWEMWNREIEADLEAGKLDSLIAEAVAAQKQGPLQEL